MTSGVPAKVIASVMGLGAFTVAIVSGLAVDNPAAEILSRALIAMVVCHLLGFAVGLLAERTVVDSVAQYIQSNPARDSFGLAAHPSESSQTTDQRAAA